jgi:hypothetical protein
MSVIQAAASCATATTDCDDTFSQSTGLLPPLLIAGIVVVVVLVVFVALLLRKRHR